MEKILYVKKFRPKQSSVSLIEETCTNLQFINDNTKKHYLDRVKYLFTHINKEKTFWQRPTTFTESDGEYFFNHPNKFIDSFSFGYSVKFLFFPSVVEYEREWKIFEKELFDVWNMIRGSEVYITNAGETLYKRILKDCFFVRRRSYVELPNMEQLLKEAWTKVDKQN